MADTPITEDRFRAILKEELDMHFERIGLVTDTADERRDAQSDFRFLRRIRLAYEATSAKVGSAILLAIVGLVITLVAAGFNLKFGR